MGHGELLHARLRYKNWYYYCTCKVFSERLKGARSCSFFWVSDGMWKKKIMWEFLPILCVNMH